MQSSQPTLNFDNTEIAFRYKSDKEVRQTARLYGLMNKAWLIKAGSKIAIPAVRLGLPFAARLIKGTIFKQFVGGTNLKNCRHTIDKLDQYQVKTILDYGVEAKNNEKDFDRTLEENMKALRFAAQKSAIPVVGTKVTGLARFSLLEKIHKGESLTAAEREEYDRVWRRMDQLCAVAAAHHTGIFFDAEESWIQKPLDDLVTAMMEKYNKGKVVVANTYQLYLKSRLPALKEAFKIAQEKGYLLGAKLVRGAYMDKERERAAAMGYPDPIHQNKEETDRAYDEAIRFCLSNHDNILLCNASHNQSSCQLMARLIDEKGLPRDHPSFIFSQLYGMSDHLTFNLAASGYNASKYVPYGAVKEVIPYLLRRAQENASVTGDMSREYQIISKEVRRRSEKK